MGKRDKQNNKKHKESAHRTKLKTERENRIRSKQKQSEKKKLNNELFEMVKRENIDQLDNLSKKKVIMELNNLILSFPNENYEKIDLLLHFLQDNNTKILMRVMKILANLFIDIMPSYKIRDDNLNNGKNENNTGQSFKFSKEVEHVHNYEKSLLKFYEKFINILAFFLKTFSSSKKSASKEGIAKLLKFIVSIICQLFEKFYLFNLSDNLYKIIVEKLTDLNSETRLKCQESLSNVLSIMDNSKNMLELKFNIIKLISHLIFIKPHEKFEATVLDLFTCHKIEFPDLKKGRDEIAKLNDIKLGPREKRRMTTSDQFQTKHEIQIENKAKKALNKEKVKILKNLKKEMGEYEHFKNDKCIFNMNLKILQKILLVFFDILKKKKDSPLIRSVLSGIGTLCDNINVEILIDLQTCIYQFVNYILENQDQNKHLFAITALKSCLNITEKLTKDIITLEDSNLLNMTFFFISKISEDKIVTTSMSKDDLFTLLEILDKIILKHRIYSTDNVASFIKRLAILTGSLENINYIPAFLLFIKRIFQKYPNLSSMKENDEDLFDYTILTDPSLCRGKQASIYKEIHSIDSKYSGKNKIIMKLIQYLVKDEKKNPEMASLNFYDLLLG